MDKIIIYLIDLDMLVLFVPAVTPYSLKRSAATGCGGVRNAFEIFNFILLATAGTGR